MIRKIGLEANTKIYFVLLLQGFRYAIITILNISHRYYRAIYCRSKDIVLLLLKKLSCRLVELFLDIYPFIKCWYYN